MQIPAWHIGVGEDGPHPGPGPGPARVDAENAGVRHAGPLGRAVKHALEYVVVGVLGRAGDLGHRVRPGQGPAHVVQRRNGPGGVPVVREGMGWRVRLKYTHPLVAGFVSLGCLSFAAIFLVGFSSSMNPSLETMRLAWMAVGGLSGWAALNAAQSNRIGASDMRIEPGRVEYSYGSQRESRPISEIAAVEVKKIEKRDSDGDTTCTYEVELRLLSGESHGLHVWSGESQARAFADWLTTALGPDLAQT